LKRTSVAPAAAASSTCQLDGVGIRGIRRQLCRHPELSISAPDGEFGGAHAERRERRRAAAGKYQAARSCLPGNSSVAAGCRRRRRSSTLRR
jgi:hypothetical protein